MNPFSSETLIGFNFRRPNRKLFEPLFKGFTITYNFK